MKKIMFLFMALSMANMCKVLFFMFCFVFFNTVFCLAQNGYPAKDKYYSCFNRNLKKALEYPDTVTCLDLRSEGFKKFPTGILQFKNLELLRLDAYYESDTIKSLNPQQRKRLKKLYTADGVKLCCPNKYKPNKIKHISEGIQKLKKLQFLDLCDTKISKKEVIRLRVLLPNCVIVSDWDDSR